MSALLDAASKQRIRIKEIDIARGLTITLVVMYHAQMPDAMNDVLRTFRMPLFFLVSGFLFSIGKYSGQFKPFLASRVWRLLIPYLTAGLLFYLLWLIRQQIGERDPLSAQAAESFVNIFLGGPLHFNGPLWFLICLFAAEMVFYWLCQWTASFPRLLQAVFFAAAGLLGYGLSFLAHLPWFLDIALVAQVFMFAGQQLKQAKLFQQFYFPAWLVAVSLVIFAGAVLINNPVDMVSRQYNNIVVFFLGGLSGSILVLQLTRLLAKWSVTVRLFSLLGRESLAILIYHLGFASVVLNMADKYVLRGLLPLNWMHYTVWGLAFSLLTGMIAGKIPLLSNLLQGVPIRGKPAASPRIHKVRTEMK